MAGGGAGPDLLDRHHQSEEPEQLLRHQSVAALPESDFEQYRFVAQSDFPRYFLNSAVVAIGTVVPTILLAFMAAYAIVRGNGRFLRVANVIFCRDWQFHCRPW